MRLKFFLTIFFVLILTAVSISSIHYRFFRQERLRLIELNLEQNAALLLNSDLSLSKSEFNLQDAQVIESIIGDDKVNMIVAIYSSQGEALYKNNNARVFDVPDKIIPGGEEWEDVDTGEYFIKYLTIKDEGEKQEQNRTIRVGMVLNQSLLRWKDLNTRINLFAGIILLVITAISFFLTQILFRPVKQLAEQVTIMGERIERGEFKDLRNYFEILGKKQGADDEFKRLITSLDKLAKKISETQAQTLKWSALMAHELKTPMTILKNSIEALTRPAGPAPQEARQVELELEKLEAIITDFLEWAGLENDTNRPDYHALPLGKRSQHLFEIIANNYPGKRLHFKNQLTSERRIFCNPIHFDQVINNLLINAIKYGEDVELVANDEFISISDKGQGIPSSVIENFGRPFNKFQQGKQGGYGLGLAWVNTIARKYDWKIHFNNQFGTTVKIIMPEYTEN